MQNILLLSGSTTGIRRMFSGHLPIFLFYTVATTFIRLPFFFRDYIDRDESTFILVGQAWVDGHLPYTQLWDLKPPLLFFYVAALIFLFGKSFIAIRFSAVLLVGLTSFFLYKSGKLLINKTAGLQAGFLYVLWSSLFGNVQGLMSEHLCMAFLVPCFWFILKAQKSSSYFGVGILMGLAVMVKLNVAYAGLFFGFSLIYFAWGMGFTHMLRIAFFYAAGVLLPIVAAFIPYYSEGLSLVWFESVILAPLHYNPVSIRVKFTTLLKLLPFILVMLWFYKAIVRKTQENLSRKNYVYLLCLLAGIIYSFISVGKFNGHYLLQLYPLFILLILIIAHQWRPQFWRNTSRGFLLLLFLVPVEAYIEYAKLGSLLINKKSLYAREGIAVPRFLKEEALDDKSVLFFDFHIGYWLLNKYPPSAVVTHPSNLARENLFPYNPAHGETSLEELRYIMEYKSPEIIVTRRNVIPFFKKEAAENEYFTAFLNQNYHLLQTVGKATVYLKN